MAKKKAEPKIVLDRTYNVPLRKEVMKVPRYQRAKKASSALRSFIVRHAKSDHVSISPSLNVALWSRGIRNPPHHIQVHVTKDEEGKVMVALPGAKKEEKAEKKGAGKEEKTATQKEAAVVKKEDDKDVKKDTVKEEKKATSPASQSATSAPDEKTKASPEKKEAQTEKKETPSATQSKDPAPSSSTSSSPAPKKEAGTKKEEKK